MASGKKHKSGPKVRIGRPRGRSGGRAGGAGYDFQDVYVAWQLAKMLMGDRDPIVEVMWEKKAIDAGTADGPEPAHVDDSVVRLLSGKWIYTQVKETAPAGGWSVRNLVLRGVAAQFWEQWKAKQPRDRERTILQLASAGSVGPLAIICDGALRSRTPSELMDEVSEEGRRGIEELYTHLSVAKEDPALLEFLKAVHPISLPDVDELSGWIIQTLRALGDEAGSLADRLIRIIAESKHVGARARSAYSRESLLHQLLADGVDPTALGAAGLIVTGNQPQERFWREYRAELVRSLRTFRVYGLDVTRPVYADLPSLYVPMKLLLLDDRAEGRVESGSTRHSVFDDLEEDPSDRPRSQPIPDTATELSQMMEETRRFVLVGTQGSGKTTTLRWLAIIAALENEDGSRIRRSFGLPHEPLIPVFIRFRRVADRIKALNRHGIRGRVGFLADFLAAEFQAGFGSHVLNQEQAIRVAYELLESENTILLFDALDEVADDLIRNQLLESVADLIDRYSAPRVVLSSRPYALLKNDLKVTLPRYSPLPFDPDETDAFCDHWYQAVRTHVSDTLSKEDAIERAVSLGQEARRIPEFAQSPLLLSILALVHFNQGGTLPVGRAKLYEHATTAMLGHWERDPARNPGDDGIPSDWATTLGLDDAEIRSAVERLAHDIQMSQAGSEFSREEAGKSLKHGLEVGGGKGTLTQEHGILLLRLLEDRAGLIQERNPGSYAFVHLGFQEYLAAKWFVGEGHDSLEDLANLASEERHGEVVRFAASVLASEQSADKSEEAGTFLQLVAEHNAVLAGACLLEAPDVELPVRECEDLARAVWSEGWYYLHHRSDIMARITWALLERCENADRVLLELVVAQDNHSRREPMGSETTGALLASRPVRPISSELRWFLRRLAAVPDEDGMHVPRGICELVLIESGAEPVGDHLASVVSQ